MNEVLDVTEHDRLAQYETVIEHGLTTFVEVGEALAAIRDARLYRAEYTTFEDYCQERWSMGKTRVYQLISAASVMANLSTIVDETPTNESHVRPMTGLDADAQREVWRRAVDTAPNGKMTAAHVEHEEVIR